MNSWKDSDSRFFEYGSSEGDGEYSHYHTLQKERVTLPAAEGCDTLCISVAAPILSAGDVLGCVIFAAQRDAAPFGETEQKLAQTVAGFLGRQMES